MRKVHSCAPRKTQLSFIYQQLVRKGEIDPDDDLERHLVAKGMRSLSGVLVITVFTAGTSWSSRAVSLEICRCRVTRCCNSNCDQWRYEGMFLTSEHLWLTSIEAKLSPVSIGNEW